MKEVLWTENDAAGDGSDIQPGEGEDGAYTQEEYRFEQQVVPGISRIEGKNGGKDEKKGKHQGGDIESWIPGRMVAYEEDHRPEKGDEGGCQQGNGLQADTHGLPVCFADYWGFSPVFYCFPDKFSAKIVNS